MARKGRSPNYPYIGLGEAIECAKKLFAKQKRAPVSPDIAINSWGFKKPTGSSNRYLSALRQYGLLEHPEIGKDVRVSEMAITIIHGTSSEYDNAVKKAALTPNIFSTLVDDYPDGFPDENGLKSALITKRKFSVDAAGRCVRSFMDTIHIAKLDPNKFATHEDEDLHADEDAGDTLSQPTETSDESKSVDPGEAPDSQQFSWPLAKGVTAEIRIFGAKVTPLHLERLRKYLELAKDAFKDEDE